MIEKLKNVDDLSLIQAYGGIWTGRQGISIEQYNKELDEADAEIDRGEYLTHEVAVKEISSWREK